LNQFQDAIFLSENLWKNYLLTSSSSSAKLSGIAEGDEFYMKAGLKRRRYTEKTEKPRKKPSKRLLTGKEEKIAHHAGVEVHITRIIQ